MSFERSGPGIGAGAEPPPASPPAGAPPGSLPAQVRLQILSTEHWSLLASRSLAWNESFARAGMFLTTLSGATVALALVAQASAFDQRFILFALVILPIALFVGITTFLRMGAANWHDSRCVEGMNRIRGAYLEMAPELRPYFVMSANDDARGIGISMGLPPGRSQLVHLLSAAPMMVTALNSVLVAVIVGLASLELRASDALALGLAAVGFFSTAALHLRQARQNVIHLRRFLDPLFPTPD